MTTLSNLPWYYFVLYAAIAGLVLWIADKFQFIKSKQLRFLVVFLVYTLVFWIVYDQFLAPK